MTAKQVRAVLEALPIRFTATAYGFELEGRYEPPSWRIESGGGIAGRSGFWGLREIRGKGSYPKVSTAPVLASQIREWAAGERPAERPGYSLYARRCSGGYAWCYRKQALAREAKE